jgi:hypothetical protein
MARGDGHGIESGGAIRHQVAVSHDKTGPDAADGDLPMVWQHRRPVY